MTDPKNTSAHTPSKADRPAQQANGGLFDGFEAYQTPTEADYRRLLTDGIVVPDTNVFLNLYRYNIQTRSDLFAVLMALGDRLWIPHQVAVEFWRNREAELQDPRDISITVRDLASQRDKSISIFRTWANRVDLREERTAQLVGVLTQAFATIITAVTELADNDALDFSRNTNKDAVLLALEPIMRGRIGSALDKHEYAEAIVEAKRRADSKIPPGFKDSGKGPLLSAGDYLVWLQIIRHAKIEQRDVLFVTGDTKEDWWRKVRGELRGPLPELVEELKDQASVRLFMLRPKSLLLQARQALRIKVHDESVQDIERVDQLSASPAVPIDIEDLRARWPEVLDSIKGKRRVAWILLSNATIADFDSGTLTLEFAREGEAKGFAGSGGYEADLNEALEEVFGINRDIFTLSPSGVVLEVKSGKRAVPQLDRNPKSQFAQDGAPSLSPGDRVEHEAYGSGRVLSVEGSSEDPEARVEFGEPYGIKHLVLRYAPVRLSGDRS
jgi:hypothetical protein